MLTAHSAHSTTRNAAHLDTLRLTTANPDRRRQPVAAALGSALLVLALATPGMVRAADTTAAEQLARFNAAAGAPGQAQRGQQFFTSRHGGEWSCASCHGQPPTQTGRHATTGKPIAPLAPGFDPRRFTDTAKVDKWFRRNCGDVLQRDCSAAEKADVMAYLVTLKP